MRAKRIGRYGVRMSRKLTTRDTKSGFPLFFILWISTLICWFFVWLFKDQP
jgi:hypothetical protein